MAIAITATGIDATGSQMRLACKLALSGNYPTGGDPIDFTTVLGAGIQSRVFVAGAPATSGDGNTSTGYGAAFILGTTLANGKIKFTTASNNAEVPNGAYPAALAADPAIEFEFIFDKLL